MELFGALAKLAAAAGLFAFLLHRGGLRPAAVVSVSLAQGMALLCVVPAPVEFVFVTTITLGTCTYAVLALDRPWLQAGVVGLCFITFGALIAHASGRLFIVLITPLALWTGLMVSIKEWARGVPVSKASHPEKHVPPEL